MMDGDAAAHQLREYRTDVALVTLLPFGLPIWLFGLFAFALDDVRPVPIVGAAALILAAGLGVTVIALVKPLRPGRTMFVLSPAGIRYQLSRKRAILIPWRQLEAVRAASFEAHG